MSKVNTAEILEHVPAVVFRLTSLKEDLKTLFVTKNISKYGYKPSKFLNGELTWAQIVHPDDLGLLAKTVRRYEREKIDKFRLHYRMLTQEGEVVPVTEYNTVNRDQNDEVLSYDAVIVTNTLQGEDQTLLHNHYRQQIVLNDILLSLHDSDLDHALQIIMDRTGEYLNCSRVLLFQDNIEHTSGRVIYEWDNYGIASLLAQDYTIVYQGVLKEVYSAFQKSGRWIVNYGEIPDNCRTAFAQRGLVDVAIFTVYLNGDHFGFVCFEDCIEERAWDEDTIHFLTNISNIISTVLARKDAAERLWVSQQTIQQMAYTDYLTKLSNRFSCDHELQKAMDDAALKNKQGYLLFIDLDDFKIVNDCYGHNYGDGILVSFANWLRENFPSPHQVFRFGGDEFVILLHHEQSVELEQVFQILRERATKPWQSLGKEFYCSLSIGASPYPSADMNSRTVVKQADIAMYEAKGQGKNQAVIYNISQESATKQRSQTEKMLRTAMENNFAEFEIFYQPIFDWKKKKFQAAEALLRLKNESQILLPQDFFTLAEYLGLTVPIGKHVFAEALKVCQKINLAGTADFKMNINMSFKQLQQKDVLAKLEKIITQTGVKQQNIMLGISEATALKDPEKMKMVCSRLQKMGFLINLDDFGEGSASFLHLGKLPVDSITTSVSLLKDFGEPATREFLHLLINLCHSMGKQICINGVENKKQADFCKKSGADMLQGFNIYGLIPKEQLLTLFCQENK